MTNSILTSTKKMLGIAEDYDAFDQDILVHINSTIATLNQLGAISDPGLFVVDDSTTWDSLIPTTDNSLEFIKSYIYLKVRVLFDPPTGGVLDAYRQMIKEYEWRINVAAETVGE